MALIVNDEAAAQDTVTSYLHRTYSIYHAGSFTTVEQIPVSRFWAWQIEQGDVCIKFGQSPAFFYRLANYGSNPPAQDIPDVIEPKTSDDNNTNKRWELHNVKYKNKDQALEYAPVTPDSNAYKVWQSYGSYFQYVKVVDRILCIFNIYGYVHIVISDTCNAEDSASIVNCIPSSVSYLIGLDVSHDGLNLYELSMTDHTINSWPLSHDFSFPSIEEEIEYTHELSNENPLNMSFEMSGEVFFYLYRENSENQKMKACALVEPYDVSTSEEEYVCDLSSYNYENPDFIEPQPNSGVLFYGHQFGNNGNVIHLVGQNRQSQSQGIWFHDDISTKYSPNSGSEFFYLQYLVTFQDNFPEEPEEQEFVGTALEACSKFIYLMTNKLGSRFGEDFTPPLEEEIYKIHEPSTGAPIGTLENTSVWSGGGFPSNFPIRYFRHDIKEYDHEKYSGLCSCTMTFVVEKHSSVILDIDSFLQRLVEPQKELQATDGEAEIGISGTEASFTFVDVLPNSVVDYITYSNFTYTDSGLHKSIIKDLGLDFHKLAQCSAPYSVAVTNKTALPPIFTSPLAVPKFGLRIDVEGCYYEAYGLNHLNEYEWTHPYFLNYVSKLIRQYTGRRVSIENILAVYKQYITGIDLGGTGRLPGFVELCHWSIEIELGKISVEEFRDELSKRQESKDGESLTDGKGWYRYKTLIYPVTYHDTPYFFPDDDIDYPDDFTPPSSGDRIFSSGSAYADEFYDSTDPHSFTPGEPQLNTTIDYQYAFIGDYETGKVKLYFLSKGIEKEHSHNDNETVSTVGFDFPKLNPIHIATFDFGFRHVTDVKVIEDKLYVAGNSPNKACHYYFNQLYRYLLWRWIRIGDSNRHTHYGGPVLNPHKVTDEAFASDNVVKNLNRVHDTINYSSALTISTS